MLAIMKREAYQSLDDISLIWACIEPTIQKVRGKNFAIKTEVYSTLNDGQKALLMFQILYGHTLHGVEEVYDHLSYLLSNNGIWTQLMSGMYYFKAFEMLYFLEELKSAYDNKKKERFCELNVLFNDILPPTIILVSAYIRNNPEQFVQFAD